MTARDDHGTTTTTDDSKRHRRALLARVLVVAAAPLAACGGSGVTTGALHFTDVAPEAGIRFRHNLGAPLPINLLTTTGAGAAFFDYDRDGWLDAFFVNGTRIDGNEDPSPAAQEITYHALFHNEGDGTFTDVTRAAGFIESTYGQGCAIADFDGDGYEDVYVTNFGPNRLYRNRGDGTFEDVTSAAGVGGESWSTGACFFDYDGDGDLDLYVANYVRFPDNVTPSTRLFQGPRAYAPEDDVLYRYDGNGVYTDVTTEAGLVPGGRGLTVVAADLDGDGDAELFVANDLTQNWLYRNEGDGTLTEIGGSSGLGFDASGERTSSMGVAVRDVDGDGRLDVHVTNFRLELNNFYRNLGDLVFRDEARGMGLDTNTLDAIGWATHFADFDLDGEIDCFVGNGGLWSDETGKRDSVPYAQRNTLFRGLGDGRFAEIGATCGADFLDDYSTRGAAFGDYDHDGDIDVLITNVNGPAQLLRNDTNPGERWLAVRFVGRAPNTAALGSRVRLTIGERTIDDEVRYSGTYLSSCEPGMHLALRPGEREGTLRVTWPTGETTTSTVRAGRQNVVEQPAR